MQCYNAYNKISASAIGTEKRVLVGLIIAPFRWNLKDCLDRGERREQRIQYTSLDQVPEKDLSQLHYKYSGTLAGLHSEEILVNLVKRILSSTEKKLKVL